MMVSLPFKGEEKTRRRPKRIERLAAHGIVRAAGDPTPNSTSTTHQDPADDCHLATAARARALRNPPTGQSDAPGRCWRGRSVVCGGALPKTATIAQWLGEFAEEALLCGEINAPACRSTCSLVIQCSPAPARRGLR